MDAIAIKPTLQRKDEEMTRNESLKVLLETISKLFETLNSDDVDDAFEALKKELELKDENV